MAEDSVRGRRLLVTGASSGIGAATVRLLAMKGAHVAALARREGKLSVLCDEVGAVPVVVDVTHARAVATAVEGAAGALGGLDGVVNNAGVMRLGSVESMPAADFRLMLEVNVLGVLHVTQAAIPHLRASGAGDVVNVGSMLVRRQARPEAIVYSATKHALQVLSDGLRRQLHDDGIRVMTVSPGLTVSDLADGLSDPAARSRVKARQQEMGLPAAVVAAEIVRALGQPRTVLMVEIAVHSTAQYD